MKPIVKRLTRHVPGRVEFRASTPDAPPGEIGTLAGYIARFGVESCVMFDADIAADDQGNAIPFVEVIDPRAFDRTLREMPDVVALFNHDTSRVLGRTTAGTLDLAVDDEGLAFANRLPDTTTGRDTKVSVGRDDIRGCSFGFCIVVSILEIREGLPALHTLLDVSLYEVTVATAFPAYLQTETQLRGLRRLAEAPAEEAGRRLSLAIKLDLSRRRLALID